MTARILLTAKLLLLTAKLLLLIAKLLLRLLLTATLLLRLLLALKLSTTTESPIDEESQRRIYLIPSTINSSWICCEPAGTPWTIQELRNYIPHP
jgi:hypothetical protein